MWQAYREFYFHASPIGSLVRLRRALLICGVLFFTTGCPYRLGNVDRSIPGGYRQLSVPIFKNYSQETGVEVAFTSALIQEFQRSRNASVVDPIHAEAEIEGEITSIQYLSSGDVSSPTLPLGAVLRSSVRILVIVKVTLRRVSNSEVLWTSEFSGEKTYTAPQVTLAGVNTLNPLYNLSARRRNIELMAGDLMAEAHDRMSENF